jgi:heterotetrameric sarcosine oxidase gamma subunit
MDDAMTHSPLATFRGRALLARLSAPAVDVVELPRQAQFLIGIDATADTLLEAWEAAIRARLPVEPNGCVLGEPTSIWLRPGSWLLLAGLENAPALHARLLAVQRTGPAVVRDVSDERVGVRVHGPAALTLLSRVLERELDAAEFGPGCCAQAAVADASTILVGSPDEGGIDLYVPRSAAAMVWGRLAQAGRDLGLRATDGPEGAASS